MTFRRVLLSEKANFHCYMIAVFAILESVKVRCIPFGFTFLGYLHYFFLQQRDASRLHMCSGLRVSCMYLGRIWIGLLECLSPL